MSKRLSTLLRHGSVPREDGGAIEFWILKDFLRNDFEYSQLWSDEMWKRTIAKGGGNKKKFQYCTDPSGQEILYLQALQGHSVPFILHCRTMCEFRTISSSTFYHIGCAINLHSIMNSGFDTRRTNFEQQTDGILHVCGSNEQGT